MLLKICDSHLFFFSCLFFGSVDLSQWKQKIEADMKGEQSLATQVLDSVAIEDGVLQEHEFFKDGILTIGCVGNDQLVIWWFRCG